MKFTNEQNNKQYGFLVQVEQKVNEKNETYFRYVAQIW